MATRINPTEDLRLRVCELEENRAVHYSQSQDAKVVASVETKSYLRRPGVSVTLGPFDTEADAKRTAELLNAYHHEAKGTWEAYSIKTVTEEKIL